VLLEIAELIEHLGQEFTGSADRGPPAQQHAAYPARVETATERRLGLGIDFGGTGIKAALLDLDTGELVSRRIRYDTPHPSTPNSVSATIARIVDAIAKDQAIPDGIPVGMGIPGVIKTGVVLTAANIDKGWIGSSANDIVGKALGRPVYAMNDADAAAVAEVRLGAARDARGTVLLLTVGTGIGSGLILNGELVPNTEFGHIELNGKDAESRVSGAARERRRLHWKTWALEFNEYIARLEAYLWPDLIILGGGVSKVIDKYRASLKSRAPILPAQFRNTSGIIGAALNAGDLMRSSRAARLAAGQGSSEAARDAAAPYMSPAASMASPVTLVIAADPTTTA
jgi:polyphosphate glucokinase